MDILATYLATALYFISRVCPFGIISMYWTGFGQKKEHYIAYVGGWLVLDGIGFLLISNLDSGTILVTSSVVLAVVRLLDLFMAFIQPFYGNDYPEMTETRRLFLILANLAETVILFASLLLVWGTAWNPVIHRPIEALYLSAVTLGTLGFGDIIPVQGAHGDPARILTLLELSFSVVFIAFGFAIMSGGLRKRQSPAPGELGRDASQ
jgi:hypothetical protein